MCPRCVGGGETARGGRFLRVPGLTAWGGKGAPPQKDAGRLCAMRTVVISSEAAASKAGERHSLNVPGMLGSSNSTSGSFAMNADGSFAGGSSNEELWDVMEYHGSYFNPFRMSGILARLLEEPLDQVRSDPRLAVYLQRARDSTRLYENLKDIPATDIAASIVAARDIGHTDAEDLSDTMVATVADHLASESLKRVSYFVTAFAKQGIKDARFWRAAASEVAGTSAPLSPQVLVSLLDAFRKSGLRSERLFTALSHRVYGVVDDLSAEHIPPMVATICRVPLRPEQRERVLLLLVGRWLAMLAHERARNTGAVTSTQILSLTVSLGLAPEELNTAPFVRDVSLYVGDRFSIFGTEDLIVFLWALQRLVVSGNLTEFFTRGLHDVLQAWPALQNSAQLSLQRLIQLSDVLVGVRHDGAWDKQLAQLRDLALQDITEAVQYADGNGMADLLEIWAGHERFWRNHREFQEAVVKRMEELLLDSQDLEDVVTVMQAALSTPGFIISLPELPRQVLVRAVQGRSGEERARIRAILAGSPWEVICGEGGGSGATGAAATGSQAVMPAAPTGPVAGGEWPDEHANAQERLLSALRGQVGSSGSTVAGMLREALALPTQDAESLLQVCEAAATFTLRVSADSAAAGEVLELLSQLADRVADGLGDLEGGRAVAALRACALAGLPHAGVFIAVARHCNFHSSGPGAVGALQVVEALEAGAILRLLLPELRVWVERLRQEGLERRLPTPGLARFVAAAARLRIIDAAGTESVAQRAFTVASPIRPPQMSVITAICQGLYLADWQPGGEADSNASLVLWQLLAWLGSLKDQPRTASQSDGLRLFALSLLVQPETRRLVEGFPEDLRYALASLLHGPALPAVRSDTTLKFQHEVAEYFREHGRAYDLHVSLAPGLGPDLALLGQDGSALKGDVKIASKFTSPQDEHGLAKLAVKLQRVKVDAFEWIGATRGGGAAAVEIPKARGLRRPSAPGVFWLLDGPESFHRPFPHTADELALVPSEQRREKLLTCLCTPSEVDAIVDVAVRWGQKAPDGCADLPLPSLGPRVYPPTAATAPPIVVRLSWMAWQAMDGRAKLALLSSPSHRVA